MLQFVFLGHTGFTFHIRHFPELSAQADHFFFNFWQSVAKLEDYGYQGHICSNDVKKKNYETIVIKVLLAKNSHQAVPYKAMDDNGFHNEH